MTSAATGLYGIHRKAANMLTVATSTATPRAQSARWRSATPGGDGGDAERQVGPAPLRAVRAEEVPLRRGEVAVAEAAPRTPARRGSTPTTMRSTAANEVDATRRWVSYVRVGIPRESTFLDMGPSFRGTPAPGVSGCRGTTVLPAPPTPRHPYRMTVGAVGGRVSTVAGMDSDRHPTARGRAPMRAVVYDRYGPPEVLRLEHLARADARDATRCSSRCSRPR